MKAAEKKIIIEHAREHNLKSVSVTIPHNSFTVVTGVSGSGKSSLVFDTLCQEGKRRYFESFSSHARQYLGNIKRPTTGFISGLLPTISVDQKGISPNPRSTVGTMTELYDFLRLLFARVGQKTDPTDETIPERSLFSFNSPKGACKECKGLGVVDRVDPALLVRDAGKSLRNGALVITTPSGYTVYSQVTIDVLNTVCKAHGFTVDIPWKDLSEEEKHIVLNGSDRLKIPYGKHTLESRMRWSGITAKPREEGVYKGIIPVIENIIKVSRNQNVLRFVKSVVCSDCNGARLNSSALSFVYDNNNIYDLSKMSIQELHDYFSHHKPVSTQAKLYHAWKDEFIKKSAVLITLGLGYLSLDRESTTLSTGESQRIRLAAQLGTDLSNVLYILDEPSIGLHHRDNRRLLKMLFQLKNSGNTVVTVEHEEDTIKNADYLIDIGPDAGINGGEILFSGAYDDFISNDKVTGKTKSFITGQDSIAIPNKRRQGDGNCITFLGACKHNLKNIDVTFKTGALNVVTGVSGAGKSTLVHTTLAKALKAKLQKSTSPADGYSAIFGAEHINKIIEIDQSPIGRTPRSNPATYTKLFNHIRDLFAAQPESIKQKWKKGRFSFNVKGGRCEKCEGAGAVQIGMHFMGSVTTTCDECFGKRFNDETLTVTFQDKTISDILEMPVNEAIDFFGNYHKATETDKDINSNNSLQKSTINNISKISRPLNTMKQLGLGYISLGQSSTTLSGGEAQRIKLATELSKPETGKTLYILDEPTTGLHIADIKILLMALNQLVERGNTVIIVEHHPDLIKSADWIIDLGPESGKNGGELVAIGTPEQVAQVNKSYTGQFLEKLLSNKQMDFSINQEPLKKDENRAIVFTGVTTHNLKNINITIPRNAITVITGVSGSGKSSVAFDTIFAEGQKRFLSSLSTYARIHMGNARSGTFTKCTGLTPVIAINQSTHAYNPRSTVGTLTEIYEYLRLLYARAGTRHCPDCNTELKTGLCIQCGFRGTEILSAQMFSFNYHHGACAHCKGLGSITVCDPDRIISFPEKPVTAGALNGSKTGRFYGDVNGQYIATLLQVGKETNIDFSVPWKDLDKKAKDIALYGTGDTTYEVKWKYKRKNRLGEHNFKSVWQGFTNLVSIEYQRKHADHRGQNMLDLMTDTPCPKCLGLRLKPEFLAVRFCGMSIGEIAHMSIDACCDYLLSVNKTNFPVAADLIDKIVKRLHHLQSAGLGYLTMHRNTNTLSAGEIQRVRLASQLHAGLTGITVILDEPTTGLHSRDTQNLLSLLKSLRDEGNTVIIVEHDEEVINAADHIIDLGPDGGVEGGHILAQGDISTITSSDSSITGRYLNTKNYIPIPEQRRNPEKGITITGAKANNLKNINLSIPAEE